MAAHGGKTFWSGRTSNFRIIDTNTFNYTDANVVAPCTLLRTLVWVTYQAYALYNIGFSVATQIPVGFALASDNAPGAPWDDATTDPGNDGNSLIAMDVQPLQGAALGWPPNSTGTLSGSVNEIDSSATLNTDENVNTFMYLTARSFVDSHSHREFFAQPEYTFSFLEFLPFTTDLLRPDLNVVFNIRHFYHQAL